MRKKSFAVFLWVLGGLAPSIVYGGKILDLNFREAAGTSTFRDSSGNSNNGACTACPTVPGRGKYSEGLNFDGGDDLITIATGTYATASAGFSVSTWVYLTAFDNAFNHICLLKSDATEPFKIFVSNNASYLGVTLGSIESGWKKLKTDSPAALFVAKWAHIVVTYNGSDVGTTGNYNVYINGVLQTLTDAGNLSDVNNVTYIGGDGSNTQHWKGRMKNFQVWNEELSYPKVTLLYFNSPMESGLAQLKRLFKPFDRAWFRSLDT